MSFLWIVPLSHWFPVLVDLSRALICSISTPCCIYNITYWDKSSAEPFITAENKSTSNVSIRGVNEYGLSSSSKIRLESVDTNDPNYNFKNLKTLQFEYNDNTALDTSSSLFFFSSSTQKTGRITIRQQDGYNASLAIFTDETTKDIVCVKNVISSSYGGTLSSGVWRKYHIKILPTGWEFYLGNNKKNHL